MEGLRSLPSFPSLQGDYYQKPIDSIYLHSIYLLGFFGGPGGGFGGPGGGFRGGGSGKPLLLQRKPPPGPPPGPPKKSKKINAVEINAVNGLLT